MTMRLNGLTQVGGVNSIENFARSWQRAAGFLEVTPRRPSFTLVSDAEGDAEDSAERFGKSDIENGGFPRTSLLRAHLEHSRESESANGPAVTDEGDVNEDEGGGPSMQDGVRGRESIFGIAPHLSTPLAGSYGTSYGTLNSTLNESSMRHAAQLWRQQQASGVNQPDQEREPLLVKEVEQDGKVVLVVAGRSTLPQTVFNSTNVLIGVGLLSLPLGIKYAGWICGMLFLFFAALVTSYTARILAKCMDVDSSLITFADLAFVSYGQKARIATSILFTMELMAACVALIVLFADTIDLLIPGVGVTGWKILCGILLIPLNFAPLRLLSFTSVLGIFSCCSSKSYSCALSESLLTHE
jgi:vesicular inhibitory amino acid transporter